MISTVRKQIALSLVALLPMIACAQDFSAILQSIEQHSTRLEAARMQADAEKAESGTITALPDPEIGFNYLFGSEGIGNRWDINVSQSFDMPTVLSQKRKMKREMQRVSELKYLSERQQLLVAAKKLCIEIVFCNAMMEHLAEDLEETGAMAEAYEILYKKSEATAIDYNKAHQAKLFFEAEHREFLAMKENLLAELEYMNGGKPVIITDSTFTHTPVHEDFDTWLAANIGRHASLQLAESEVKMGEQSLKLAKSERLPGLKLGYMGEFAREDKYQGPTIGLSLPLWGASRKVKAAQKQLEATRLSLADTRMQLVTQMRNTHRDVLQLQETYRQFSSHLTDCDNEPLLLKSLEKGQINMITYLQERQFVHEMHEKLLATERDLELRKAELLF